MMARWVVAVVMCGALACGKADAPATDGEAVPEDAVDPADRRPGEDAHAWFVRWMALLAEVADTGETCADIGARWDDMANRGRPHFAEIKRIESAQSDAENQAFLDEHQRQLAPAKAKVQAAMARCKDDPAFQRALRNVRTLL